MKRRTRRVLVAAALVWALTLTFSATLPAAADIRGPCTATIAGVDVNQADSPGTAVEVDQHSQVPVFMQATRGARFASHSISLEFAGLSWEVSSGQDDSDQWTDTVNVGDYAKYGVGIYKVQGSAILSPTGTCSGAAYVKVVGRNPLTTVAGAAAAGATAVGAAGLLAGVAASVVEGQATSARVGQWVTDRIEEQALTPQRLAARREEEADQSASTDDVLPYLWCLFFALPAAILTGMTMATGGGVPAAPEPSRLPRVAWRPRISVVSTLGGPLAGVGVVVLLQQYGVLYLSRAVAIEGLVGGLAVGLLLPSLIRALSVSRVNGAIARAERRLSEAQVSQPPEEPQA